MSKCKREKYFEVLILLKVYFINDIVIISTSNDSIGNFRIFYIIAIASFLWGKIHDNLYYISHIQIKQFIAVQEFEYCLTTGDSMRDFTAPFRVDRRIFLRRLLYARDAFRAWYYFCITSIFRDTYRTHTRHCWKLLLKALLGVSICKHL